MATLPLMVTRSRSGDICRSRKHLHPGQRIRMSFQETTFTLVERKFAASYFVPRKHLQRRRQMRKIGWLAQDYVFGAVRVGKGDAS